MWVGTDGRCHTVAVPNSDELMSPEYLESLAVLLTEHRGDAEDILGGLEVEAALAAANEFTGSQEEETFEGVAPVGWLLTGVVSGVQDLRRSVEEIPLRWRLDAVCALLDQLTESR